MVLFLQVKKKNGFEWRNGSLGHFVHFPHYGAAAFKSSIFDTDIWSWEWWCQLRLFKRLAGR